MLSNVAMGSWIIGSMTLIIVKKDEKTGVYRDTLRVLEKYARLHDFDKILTKRLRTQLKLDFDSRETADEQVLHFFPASVRRKILRRLYMPSVLKTRLMQGTRQHFVDAFLSLCTIETFSPGEELLQFGVISTELYLLLEGSVEISTPSDQDKMVKDGDVGDTRASLLSPTSVAGSSVSGFTNRRKREKISEGDFINDLGKLSCMS